MFHTGVIPPALWAAVVRVSLNRLCVPCIHPTSQGRGLPLPLSLPMDPDWRGTDASGASFWAQMSFLQCRRVRRLRAFFFDANVVQLWCIFERFWVHFWSIFGPSNHAQTVFVNVLYRIHAKSDFDHPLQGFAGFSPSC